jgi:hypothetical protein
MRCYIQGPTAEGGLSNLFLANATRTSFSCAALSDATILSVPIYDFAIAIENEEFWLIIRLYG